MKRGPRRREITYYVPETNISFAENRMQDFVEEYSWRQLFSARLPRGRDTHPTPTLLDLAVSAYLQGVEDTVQVSTKRGFNFGGSDEHLRRGSEAVPNAGRDGGSAESAHSGLEGHQHQVAAGESTAGTRSDGPHAPESEFGMPMW